MKIFRMCLTVLLSILFPTLFAVNFAGAGESASDKGVAASNVQAKGENIAEPCIQLKREIPSGKYTPGEPLQVVLLVEADCPDKVTAFGISETLPRNWHYVSAEATTGTLPTISVRSTPEAPDILEMSWITPGFPIEIHYTLQPSVVSEEVLEFNGHGSYALEALDLQDTTSVLTRVEPVDSDEGDEVSPGDGEPESPDEGEGETEVTDEGEGEAMSNEESPICCRSSKGPDDSVVTHPIRSLTGDGALVALMVACLFACTTLKR